MMDSRSPRIHLSLTIWSLLLIGLVLVEIRHLPPGLTVLLVPYLALMSRHWVGRLRQRGQIEPALPLGDAAESPSDDELEERADSSGSPGRSGYDDSPQPASPHPTEELVTLPSRRGRARRTKAPQVEPIAASWVQIRPGRFVRVDEVAPEPPADDSRPDEPHGATPSDEPGTPLEAGSTSADADAEVSRSEVEANHAGPDPTEAIVPEVRGEGSDGSPDRSAGDRRGESARDCSLTAQSPQGQATS
jgi:hypothetical protein